MSDLVERVARALYDDDPIANFMHPVPWDQIKEWSRGKYRKRARAAIEAMPGWEPIETAPTDGAVVMVYGPQAGEISGPNNVSCVCLAYWSGKGDYEGYEWSTADGDYYTVWVKPTHWMPLPAPPAAALKPEVQP